MMRILPCSLILLCLLPIISAFIYVPASIHGAVKLERLGKLHSSISSNVVISEPGKVIFPPSMSDEWEIDCYSRPVLLEDGKKLWELLVTDSSGSFRYLQTLPSNVVNSKNLRKSIEELIEAAPNRPRVIRFFRNQMFNMVTIALKEIANVEVKPSRRTHHLAMWLEEREEGVYPKMKGYNPSLKQQTILDYEVSQPDRLPDVMRAKGYAFCALPSEAFHKGEIQVGEAGNVLRGHMAPLAPLPRDTWVHGVTLFSPRAAAIAAWMSGLEIAHIRADLIGGELLMSEGITQQFLLAPLGEKQKLEARTFERGKLESGGYHFLAVQETPESEEVKGFWLLRQFGNNL